MDATLAISTKTSLKIAILTDGIFPYVIGGMQKHSYYLTKFLVEQGADVTLLHCVPDSERLIHHEKVVLDMGLLHADKFKSICLKFPRPDRIPGHYVKESYHYSQLIFERIKEDLNKFDFIYAKGFSAWHLIDQKNKGLTCPPIGVKFHGYEMFQPAASLKTKLEHLILRSPVVFNNVNADWVFSYGGKITPIIEKIGVERHKIIELPTGIDSKWCVSELSHNTSNKRHLLFVGRYERRKGIEELNRVLLGKLKTHDFIFHFIGPIPEKKKLRSPRIIYHGKVMDIKVLRKIMDQCQILVTPSHSEGMPNVIMEGMARGLSVIATDVGAISIQVDNRSGWLIEANNYQELSDAMTKALEISENDLTNKRMLSLKKVEDHFTWKAVSIDTISAIENTINL